MAEAENDFKCPKWMLTCPTDQDKPGVIYCAWNNLYECPIKYLRLYSKATLPKEVIENPDTYEFYSIDLWDQFDDNHPILIKSRSIGESPI